MFFKTIIRSVRTSPGLFLLIAAGALFELASHYLFSVSYKYLIDLALIPRDASMLSIIIGSLLALGICSMIAGVASDYAKAKLSSKLVFDYRIKLFKQMQMQSHRFYARFRGGDLMARYTEDVPNIQAAVQLTVSSGLISILSVPLGIAILWTLEWRLTLIAVVGSALVFLPYRLLKSRSRELNGAYTGQLDRFMEAIDENIKSYQVIRGFDLRSEMRTRVEDLLRIMLSIGVKRSFVNANLSRLPNLGVAVLTTTIFAVGSYFASNGALSIGSFITFNSVFITVGQSLFGVAALLPHILTARTSLRRYQEVLDWQPDVKENGTRELPAISRELEFRKVSFEYVPGQKVLRHLNLTLPATGYTSIVGASGSGKSTVLQLLLRFEDPSEGAVLYDGHDIREFAYGSLLRQVGVVFQDSILLGGTIRDNIRMGKPDAEDREVEEAARAAGIHEEVICFADGYDTVILNQGSNLSGGQRQRIALARALVRNPRVLFLDEATSALDPETERAVYETVRSLAKDRAVVSVTHRLAHAALSDRIIVLDGGRMAESGSHEELRARGGLYRRMWDKQQGFILFGKGDSARVETDRLALLPFLEGLEPSTLREIAGLFVAERFEAGERAVAQGEKGDKFYLIARGKVEVVAETGTGEHGRLAVLEDGDHFGEIALLRNVPRTASVIALTPSLCLALSRPDFDAITSRYPSIRRSLEASLKLRNERSAAQ